MMSTFLRTSLVMLVAVCCAAVVICVNGCGEKANQDINDRRNAAQAIRIVSFSPAISRTLIDFGLQDRIVGRTTYCDFLPEEVPVVGDLHSVNYERLIELDPTHVLLQPSSAGVDRRLTQLGQERGWTIAAWPGIDQIDDIEQLVRELPGVLCQGRSDDEEEMARTAAELTNRIAASLAPGDAPLWRGRTLIVHSTQPVRVFGRGTYLNDVLTRLGASNAVEAEGWKELSLEDVLRLNPEAIIIIRPGEADWTDAMEAAGALGRLEIDAVRNRRVALLTHPDALLPSTGIIKVAGELRTIMGSMAATGEGPA